MTDRDCTADTAAQAAAWHLELQAAAPSLEKQALFAQWLRRSPLHVEEFLRVLALQADLGRIPEFNHTDVDALLAGAARSGPAKNVIDFPLQPRTTPEEHAAAAARPGRRLRIAGAGLGVAAAALVAAIIWMPTLRASWSTSHYTTGVGEQRTLRLRDGSQVEINVRSDLAVHIDARTRDLNLETGEALFKVAHDPQHPFRVRTPQAVIEAKGTRFDVQVRDGHTLVVLLEGRVQVTAPGPRGGAVPVMLSPGESLVIGAGGPAAPEPVPADIATTTAWLQGRLVFDDAPLAHVVEEFNRYSSEQVVIDDPAAAELRITASFDAGNIPLFARSVGAAAGLKVTREADGRWHIASPGQP